MGVSWIKFETSTSDKPEVWQIADRLGIDPDAVVGKLLRIWAWFDDQTESGNAPLTVGALLDRKVGVSGFVNAMILAGWMHEKNGVLTLPNFDRHNGETAKSRALTAKRVAKHKEKGNATTNAPLTVGALPREEKSRVEKRETKVSVCEFFETWWSHYPKKVSKEAASKAYAKALAKFSGDRSEAAKSLLMESLPRFAELKKREARFVPHPATWLNAGGWSDDVESIAPETAEIPKESKVMTTEQLAEYSRTRDAERFLQ
jgi:hypothetical protein